MATRTSGSKIVSSNSNNDNSSANSKRLIAKRTARCKVRESEIRLERLRDRSLNVSHRFKKRLDRRFNVAHRSGKLRDRKFNTVRR